MKSINITKWLHFTELGGDPWVLPIWAAVNDAVKVNKIRPVPDKANELGYHISIRLNMLPRIINRINAGCKELYPMIRNAEPKYEFSPKKEGYGLRIDYTLKYNLIIDVDALLFELNACCDFMKEFLTILYNHTGNPINIDNAGLAIKKILEAEGLNIDWFVALDRHRNFFMHEGTATLAVDISEAPQKYDLIVMSEIMWYILPNLKKILYYLSKNILKNKGCVLINQAFYKPGIQKYGNEFIEKPEDLINLVKLKLIKRVDMHNLNDFDSIMLFEKK